MEEIRMRENTKFLQDQIITYIGNKRSLNPYIETENKKIKKALKKEKLVALDLFSGSGIVARMLKKHSERLIANDLEEYSQIINECYLSNHSDFDRKEYDSYKEKLQDLISKKLYTKGIVSSNYAPKNDIQI
jgi:adenine-specific DNA-methyltransferase